jgi:hypothetical protein
LAHFELSDPAEDKLRQRIEELFAIRRRFLEIDPAHKAIRKAGTKCWKTFEREFRASLRPKPAKAKIKAGKV